MASDPLIASKVQKPQGSDELVIASGGALTIEAGGSLSAVNGTIKEAGRVSTFTMTAATGGSNVTEVTITPKDANGTAVTGVLNYDLWLSDATTGAGLTATTASGSVTVKTSSGEVIGTLTTKKALRVQSLATGLFILSITDTAKTAFKVCAAVPGTGVAVVGITLATGDYG